MVSEEVVHEDPFEQSCDDLVALNHFVDTIMYRVTYDGKRVYREVVQHERMRCAELYAHVLATDEAGSEG